MAVGVHCRHQLSEGQMRGSCYAMTYACVRWGSPSPKKQGRSSLQCGGSALGHAQAQTTLQGGVGGLPLSKPAAGTSSVVLVPWAMFTCN